MSIEQETLAGVLQRHKEWVDAFYSSIDSSLLAAAPLAAFYGAIEDAERMKPGYRADLTGADLANVSLRGANLMLATLRGADLSNAWLVAADLVYADLRNVCLRGARAYKARLDEADLTDADLTEADFSGADLEQANLAGANLSGAEFARVYLERAILTGADLRGANLVRAILRQADLSGANLADAVLAGADLTQANFDRAVLRGANLERAILIDTSLRKADLSGAKVYGVSVWDVEMDDETKQKDLFIWKSRHGEPPLSVRMDNLEVAQFIYLLLNREKLRDVINTVTSKAVLILGRFTKDRVSILEAVSSELRKYDLLPIIFDFDRPMDRDLTETIKVLAGLCLFVIADITNPKSAPLELQATVPDYKIPFVLIIEEGEEPFSMFRDLRGKYHWVLTPVTYTSISVLLEVFEQAILERAWEKHKELRSEKLNEEKSLSAEAFLKKH